MSLNVTPSANRLHIGIFGKVNSGKSSFLNAITGQESAIVSTQPGTTTDAVSKAMELQALGPCVLIDTAGFDDTTILGEERVKKTLAVLDRCDMAVLMIASVKEQDLSLEKEWYLKFIEKKIPVIVVVNQNTDIVDKSLLEQIYAITKNTPIVINAKSRDGIEDVIKALVRNIPEQYELPYITGDLVGESDTVMLVMPQDAQAPKGRLILPQVQTTRELLDKRCIIISVTPDKMESALAQLKNPPKLIITDSQVFKTVYERKPEESLLTSFSVLFAGYKGDLPYYIEGAKAIDTLKKDARILIAECCTHAPATEDIGRVKIPAMLKKKVGEKIHIEVVSGTDFPSDLKGYDLIIQCGGCMFNRRYVLSRIESAISQEVPMTNYGIAIAHMTGILDKVSY